MAKTGTLNDNGNRVYEYVYYTYGLITSTGIAVTVKPNIYPFFEIDKDSVTWDGEYEAKCPRYPKRKNHERSGQDRINPGREK